jgi:hypothetical protein
VAAEEIAKYPLHQAACHVIREYIGETQLPTLALFHWDALSVMLLVLALDG